MADRSTYVTVGARVDGFIAGLNKMKTETTKFSKGLSLEASKNEKEFTQLGVAMGAIGTVGAVGIGAAISKFAEFDQAISFVQAATHESAGNMKLLKDAALEAGASTVFSATESANAIEELSKAGLSTSDILGGALTGSLDLAAAGGLGVARAAEIASTTLQQFQLDGSEAGHVADVLAAGAGKAMGSVEDLANGLKFVGPVANAMGVSLEETAGTLALFAQQGIIGEQAGTSLRGVLASLTSPSAQARGEIEKLGLTLYDSQGNFLGLQNAAGELSAAYTDMDGASRDASMGIIFGRETITAATALYQAGAEGVQEWTKAVDDSGYAAETAAIRLDNLTGDIEAFGGAADTAFIKTGSASNDALRGLVQTGTALIDVYNSAPASIQGGVLALGGITTAATLAGGAFFLAAPKVVEFRTALSTLKTEAPKTTAALSAVGKGFGALAAVTVALTALNTLDEMMKDTGATAEELQNKLETVNFGSALESALGGIEGRFGPGFFNEMSSAADNFKGVLESIGSSADTRSMGFFGDLFTGKAGGTGINDARDALEKLGGVLAGLPIEESTRQFSDFAREQKLSKDEVMTFLDAMPEFRDALVNQATELGLTTNEQTLYNLATADSAPVTKTAAEAYMDAAGEADGLTDSLSALIGQINEANGVGQDAISANIDYQDALAKVDEQVAKARAGTEGYALTLDQATQEGRDNLGMLNNLAGSAQEAAAKQFALDGNTDNYRRTLESSRDALVKRAQDLGMTADEAGTLADQIFRIPSKKEMEVIAHTADASAAIQRFIELNSGKVIRVAVQATNTNPGSWTGGITKAEGGLIDYYANGGLRERHIAQIAPAGAWRVWAEPETGGEAYIPLAPGKRARSLEIWAETGRRLQAFADGGFSSQPVYVPESRSFAMGAGGVAPDLRVSLEGATLVMTVDGRPMTALVKEQIVSHSKEQSMSVRAKLR